MSKLQEINKSKIQDFLDNKYDIFICSSSFDKRCLSLPSQIVSCEINGVILCHFENNYEESDSNANKIENYFSGSNSTFKKVLLKKNNPLSNYDSLYENIVDFSNSGVPKILFDITSFTRESLFIIIKLITVLYKENANLTFCYTPTPDYPGWLSKGVRDIRSVLGYSGDYSPLKGLLLVILTGFEFERAQVLIENYEPSKLLIGMANSAHSINPSLSNVNQVNFNNLMEQNCNAESFEFSCIDIDNTINVISSIVSKYGTGYNIIVSPMNNKLSSIAVAFAALINPEIQICYASTNQYNIKGEYQETDSYYFFDFNQFIKFS